MARETEAKFYIKHPDDLRQRIEAHGGVVSEPRVHELNLRFDTRNHDLRGAGRVLRLRQDTRARLTYKDPDQALAGSLSRRALNTSSWHNGT